MSDYRVIDSALVAICIIFLQYLIAVEKPDSNQITSLILFSTAIPILAIHFFTLQTFPNRNISIAVPAYIAISFNNLTTLGMCFTATGILSELHRVSLIAMFATALSSIFAIAVRNSMMTYINRKLSIDTKEDDIIYD
jgi:hypothetical protein